MVYTLMWWIVADDDPNGVGIGIPYLNDEGKFTYKQYHQETFGL